MNIKKQVLASGIFILIFAFLFSGNAQAQTCTDNGYPAETGQCRSGCLSGEHEISGTCMGQACCAPDPSGGTTNSSGKGAGENCSLSSECQSGLTCYAASGASQATCQTVSYAGDTAPTGSSGLPAASSSTVGGGWSLGNISTFGLPGGLIGDILVNILVWMLGIFGIIGIIGFIISGIIYITAAGDEDRMAYAKRAMLYSIIGVVVGLVGFVIIQAVDMALNAISSF